MFTPLPHAARRAKPWNYCLIMVLRIIFLDSKNKILKIGCRNRGFPKIQKIFFFKNVNIQNAKTSPVLNIFRRDRAQMKANMISHITCFWDFAISPQGAVESFRRKICRQNGFRGFPRTPWGEIAKSQKQVMCEIMLAFMLALNGYSITSFLILLRVFLFHFFACGRKYETPYNVITYREI